MTEEMVELNVEILVKADGSDSAWQMNRLCEGMDVSPVGVFETFRVKTTRSNADRLLAMSNQDWERWTKNQRHGLAAFQVLAVAVYLVGDEPSDIPAHERKFLLQELYRKRELETQLAVANARVKALEEELALLTTSHIADAPVYQIPPELQKPSGPTCSKCNWTNTTVWNLGKPGEPLWVCQQCAAEMVRNAERLLAETEQKPADIPEYPQ